MGKKRVIKKSGEGLDSGMAARSLARLSKKKITEGILNVEATYNNTKVALADMSGNVLLFSSSGALGFKGAKKGTPFAAGKVGDILGEKAALMGLKEAHVVIRGVGSGRESAVRSFMSHGITLKTMRDKTPVPHNGPKPKKPRRI